MTAISANPQITSAPLFGISSATADSAEKKAPALRSAADVVKLDSAPVAKNSGAPELREPVPMPKGSSADEAGPGGGIYSVIAALIGMLNQLMLSDSKRVGESGNREVQLAASSANAQRNAGKAEMTAGIASASAQMVGTAMSTFRSIKGTNLEMKSAKLNVAEANVMNKRSQVGNLSSAAQAEMSQTAEVKSMSHMLNTSKGRNMQVQGQSAKSLGDVASKVVDSNLAAQVGGYRAEQAVAAGDAGVAGRTTDMELKARSMTDELTNQMRAIRDRDIQSKNDAAAHVAQGSR